MAADVPRLLSLVFPCEANPNLVFEMPLMQAPTLHSGYGSNFLVRPAVLISRCLAHISSYVHGTTGFVDVQTLPFAFRILWLSA